MSKIFDLINELCPNGVKFDELGVICKSLVKGTLKQEDLVDKGAYPVVNSSRDYYGFYDKYNNEANAFTVASRGEYAGFVKFIDCKFWAGGLCYPYTSNDEEYVLTKFIFYFLKSIEKKNMDILVARGSIPALNKSDFDKVKIPVPPMEVQREIVRILDSFTSVTEELMAKLTAELIARKKQYEFYRDFLLSFDELDKNGGGCELKMLGEIADIVRGQRVTKAELQNDGKYPVVSGGIKPLGFLNRFNREANTITVAQYGTAGYINFIEEKFWANDVCYCIFPKKEMSNKFLLYCLMKNQGFIYSLRTNAIPAHLPQKLLSEIKIPVPSLQTQQKVVDILDKFDTLVNSITEGLPREIELRRKQYEHYRELLLNFKPKMTA
ncbi:restriction endonuclease subunit S [Campylobacter concisus]|uniref:restriction endonuclease subunit S n=1 Tax=Campylobacter concisus TaxID=199 RepID=UPI001CE409C1|nr:restriction endonuclease subunit S [Campylobacter concisus]MCA6130966.1 restriction endonuclease subunit S [Campylobacter concisus]MCA6132440.1 restriction endonuclease subunit S [Campylobacter concisus]